jgi:hypothetical protein
MEPTQREECRDCKTILYLSFAALLALFVLAYLTRPGDAPLTTPFAATSTPAVTP